MSYIEKELSVLYLGFFASLKEAQHEAVGRIKNEFVEFQKMKSKDDYSVQAIFCEKHWETGSDNRCTQGGNEFGMKKYNKTERYLSELAR